MDIVKEKRKWLWPMARLAGLLPISFKDCVCPSALAPSGHLSPLDRTSSSKQECTCPVAARSVPWMVYSLVVAAVLLPSSMVAPFRDQQNVHAGRTSLRMTTKQDEIVTFIDILSVSASTIICFLQAALSQSSLFEMISQLQQADRLLAMQPPAVPGVLALWLAVLVVFMVLDGSMWTQTSQGIMYSSIYFPFYGLYLNTFIMEVLFIDEAHSIHLRFLALNQKLEATLALPSYQDVGGRRIRPRATTPGVVQELTPLSGLSAPIQRLNMAHHLLCESTLSVSRRHGLSLLGDLLCLLLHLVITAYFFLKYLFVARLGTQNQSVASHYILIQAGWLAVHLGRILMIVLPCSRACAEASRTGALVGVVLSTSTPATVAHKQLETFSIQLLHHRVNFNACGLFDIGLPLVVSIMGAVTTYLVVLLQIKSSAEAIVQGNATTASATS